MSVTPMTIESADIILYTYTHTHTCIYLDFF